MGKVFLFLFDGMTDYEVTFVAHLLHADAGKEVIPIAYRDEVIKGNSGLQYQPVKLLADLMDEEAEGLILPGGWNSEIRPELLELIRRFHSRNRLLGGICGAGTVCLAMAGVLEDVLYTTPAEEWTQKHARIFGDQDPFPRENYRKERVVRDRNVITAQGTAFVDFAVEICDWFGLFADDTEKKAFQEEIKGS